MGNYSLFDGKVQFTSDVIELQSEDRTLLVIQSSKKISSNEIRSWETFEKKLRSSVGDKKLNLCVLQPDQKLVKVIDGQEVKFSAEDENGERSVAV